MSKFSIKLELEIEGEDVDDAITRAAMFFALNVSGKRPILTIQPSNPFEFPGPREYNVLEEVGNALFSDGNLPKNMSVYIEPKGDYPQPEGIM